MTQTKTAGLRVTCNGADCDQVIQDETKDITSVFNNRLPEFKGHRIVVNDEERELCSACFQGFNRALAAALSQVGGMPADDRDPNPPSEWTRSLTPADIHRINIQFGFESDLQA